MANLQDLGATAALILESFVRELEALDIELPERQYVAPGALVSWDGEQLTVHLQSIDQGQPGAQMAGTYTPTAITLTATFGVSIVRAVPSLENDGPISAMVPDSPELGVAGGQSMADASALVRAAIAAHAAYDFTGPGEGFEIGPLTPLGPEGGLSGHRLLITLSLT